jgi:hypothetical protein
MIEQLVTRYETARLELHRRELRRREEAAITRLGEKTLADAGGRSGRLASLATEAAATRGRMRSIAAERGESPPAATRRRLEALERQLQQIHQTAGRLVLAMPPTGAESEVLAIRAEMADAASEQDRLRGEGQRMVEETSSRVRAWVGPRAPALVTMAVAWLIAHGYAGSHTEAILTSFGLSPHRRGSHLVSLATDTFLVRQGLPLLAAVISGYLAHRLAARAQAAVESVRARSGQASQAGTAGTRSTRDALDRRAVEKSR